MADQEQSILDSVRLSDLVNTSRMKEMDRCEAYYQSTQYNHLQYDWNGATMSYGDEADIGPGYYVPLKRRKPSARYDLPKIIVNRFTNLVFGHDRWPQVRIEGDPDAEDYVRTLVEVSRLKTVMGQARGLGGACGSVCMSFTFVGGKPRVEVHNAKYATVLRWADRAMMRPASAIYAYSYKRSVWDEKEKKFKKKDFYFARFWDEGTETVWDPIPGELADQPGWNSLVPSNTVEHGFGFCPFYWIQNTPDSIDIDGMSDYEGCLDNCDAINRTLSATNRGTIANVDPTLVIKMDPNLNMGNVRKGSDNAIFSPGGAEYLELKGDAIRAAKEEMETLKQAVLDACSVILLDPKETSGYAQSAAAIRQQYAPMLSACDILREQYGETGLKVILKDMLVASKMIINTAPGPEIVTEDGRRIQHKPTVVLPQRVLEGPDGKITFQDRTPGSKEDITLDWPPYFPETWADIEKAVNATQKAAGGKSIISHRTGVQQMAKLFGIGDVPAELAAIQEEREHEIEEAERLTIGPKMSSSELFGEEEEPKKPKSKE